MGWILDKNDCYLTREELISKLEKLSLENQHLRQLLEELDFKLRFEKQRLIDAFRRAQIGEGIEQHFAVLARSINKTEMSERTRNVILTAGVHYVFQLLELCDSELVRIRGFGPSALQEVQGCLADFGLSELRGVKIPNDIKLVLEALIDAEWSPATTPGRRLFLKLHF